jgi:hypothetical protein
MATALNVLRLELRMESMVLAMVIYEHFRKKDTKKRIETG